MVSEKTTPTYSKSKYVNLAVVVVHVYWHGNHGNIVVRVLVLHKACCHSQSSLNVLSVLVTNRW